MKKIAFLNITQGLIDRGAETFVQEVSKRLEKNYQVDVLCGTKIPPEHWPILWRSYFDPHGLTILWWILRMLPKLWRERYDIVIPLNGGFQSLLVRLLTWLYGGKVVISGQSGKGWDDRVNLWTFPDAFVAISSHLTRWARNVNSSVKIEYIPNGVDLSVFKPQGTKPVVKIKYPIILCVGALTDEKRIELVIQAVARLTNVSLLVIGEGPKKEELTQLGAKLLGNRFFLTKSSHQEISKWYRVADLFTLPSPWYRSFEIVFVEALATNVPVVANDDPIRREIIGDAGLFTNPEKPEEYAAALTKALSIEWGNKPRTQAEKFSWDKITKQYEAVFEELYA